MNSLSRPSTWIFLLLLILIVPMLPFMTNLLMASIDPHVLPSWEFGYYGDLHRVKRQIMESGCAEAVQLGAYNPDLELEEVELKVKTKWGRNRSIDFDASKDYAADVKQQIDRLCHPPT
jgi:hypothetical protein